MWQKNVNIETKLFFLCVSSDPENLFAVEKINAEQASFVSVALYIPSSC